MKPLLLACWAFLALATARAQEPYLVRDIAPTPEVDTSGIFPFEFEVLGDALYFQADDGFSGAELWRTDGTAAGTRRVVDLCPGRCGSVPSGLSRFGDQLYFFAADGPLQAIRWWRTDGTAEGTRPSEKDGRPDDRSMPVQLNGETFFILSEAGHGSELWKTRGGLGEAVMVKDINPGPADGVFGLWGASGGRVVFLADDGVHGLEAWSSDGTAAGTRMLRDINPRGAGVPRLIGHLAASLGGYITFRGDDGVAGPELWRTDGTPQGTTMLRAFAPGRFGTYPFHLVRAGRFVYFEARDVQGQTRLWRTDGTAAGTVILQLAEGAVPTLERVDLGGILIFTATDARYGHEVWRSDGRPKGTFRLADIAPGPLHASNGNLGLVRAGGQVFFGASDPEHGLELWRTDGRRAGTRRVADLIPGPASGYGGRGAELRDRLVFVGLAEGGSELWISDGSSAGTRKIVDIRPAERSSDPAPMAAVGAQLLFSTLDSSPRRRLWRSAGSADDTVPFAELAKYEAVRRVAPLPGQVLFSTDQRTLWRSDATAAGTAPLPAFTDVRGLAAVGGRAFFVADAAGSPANTLFVSDGSTHTALRPLFATTEPQASDTPQPQPELPAVEAGGRYFVFAQSYTLGGTQGLWRSDGTADGTVHVADLETLCPEPCFGAGEMAAAGNLVFFTLAGQDGISLWRSDGTKPGTVRLLLAHRIAWEQGPRALTAAGARLFFLSQDPVHGEELWTSDGTPAGTMLVRNVRPGEAGARIAELRAVGGAVFFGADDGEHGRELWTSDGSEGGTHLVADLRPGPPSGEPQSLAEIDGRLIFAAVDPAHGLELWSSDGTPAGTALIGDIVPGRRSGSPAGFVAAGDLIYFRAGTPDTGYELWALSRSALAAP